MATKLDFDLFYRAGKALGTDPYQGLGSNVFKEFVKGAEAYIEAGFKKLDKIKKGIKDIDMTKVNPKNSEMVTAWLTEKKEEINEYAKDMAFWGGTKKGKEATELYNKANDAILNLSKQLLSYQTESDFARNNYQIVGKHAKKDALAAFVDIGTEDMYNYLSISDNGDLMYDAFDGEGNARKTTRWNDYIRPALLDTTVGKAFTKMYIDAKNMGLKGMEYEDYITVAGVADLINSSTPDSILSAIYNSKMFGEGETGVTFMTSFLYGLYGEVGEGTDRFDTLDEQRVFFEQLKSGAGADALIMEFEDTLKVLLKQAHADGFAEYTKNKEEDLQTRTDLKEVRTLFNGRDVNKTYVDGKYKQFNKYLSTNAELVPHPTERSLRYKFEKTKENPLGVYILQYRKEGSWLTTGDYFKSHTDVLLDAGFGDYIDPSAKKEKIVKEDSSYDSDAAAAAAAASNIPDQYQVTNKDGEIVDVRSLKDLTGLSNEDKAKWIREAMKFGEK